MKTSSARWIGALLLSLGCTTGDLPAAWAASTPAGKPVVIGLIAGTTGAYGTTGVQTVQGAQVAVDNLNAEGVSEGAVAIVGSPSTGPVTAQLADRYRIPDIGVVDGGGLTVYPNGPAGDPHPWVFEFGGNTFAWGGKIAQYALKHCPGGLAVLHDRTSYGEGGLAGIQQVYDKAGKKLVSNQPVTENWSTGATAGLIPEIDAAKAAGADCIVMWLTPQDQAALVQDAHSLGDKFTLLGNDETNADATFVNLAGPDADGVIGAFLTSTMNPSPALNTFIDAYKKKFNQEPSQYSETTYDSIMMLAAMIKKTGTTHPQALRAAFNGASQFPGITGELSFSPKKHVTITSDDLTLVRYDAASKKWVSVSSN